MRGVRPVGDDASACGLWIMVVDVLIRCGDRDLSRVWGF